MPNMENASVTLISVEGDQVTRAELPQRVQPVHLHPHGPGGLFVVGNRLTFTVLQQPGQPWHTFQGPSGLARSDIAIESDGEGAYVVVGGRGLAGFVLLPEGQRDDIRVPDNSVLGANRLDWPRFAARERGLFVLYGRGFYFWSKAAGRWEARSMPEFHGCQGLKIDATGADLAIRCRDVDYRSSDGGASWTPPRRR